MQAGSLVVKGSKRSPGNPVRTIEDVNDEAAALARRAQRVNQATALRNEKPKLRKPVSGVVLDIPDGDRLSRSAVASAVAKSGILEAKRQSLERAKADRIINARARAQLKQQSEHEAKAAAKRDDFLYRVTGVHPEDEAIIKSLTPQQIADLGGINHIRQKLAGSRALATSVEAVPKNDMPVRDTANPLDGSSIIKPPENYTGSIQKAAEAATEKTIQSGLTTQLIEQTTGVAKSIEKGKRKMAIDQRISRMNFNKLPTMSIDDVEEYFKNAKKQDVSPAQKKLFFESPEARAAVLEALDKAGKLTPSVQVASSSGEPSAEAVDFGESQEPGDGIAQDLAAAEEPTSDEPYQFIHLTPIPMGPIEYIVNDEKLSEDMWKVLGEDYTKALEEIKKLSDLPELTPNEEEYLREYKAYVVKANSLNDELENLKQDMSDYTFNSQDIKELTGQGLAESDPVAEGEFIDNRGNALTREIAHLTALLYPSGQGLSGGLLRSKRAAGRKVIMAWMTKHPGKSLEDLPKAMIKRLQRM